jgi:hypothetical protein
MECHPAEADEGGRTMDKVNEMMKGNGMRELRLDELDMVSGGWTKDQLTPEERQKLEHLANELMKEGTSDNCDQNRLYMIADQMEAFYDELKAIYG